MAGVETQHKNFKTFYDDWVTMRHVFAGERTLKANSKRYIAPLDGQDDTDYKEFTAKNVQVADKVLYTGMIDEYYDYKLGVLEYRSVRFEQERYEMDMLPRKLLMEIL
jgi:hypothetical protein